MHSMAPWTDVTFAGVYWKEAKRLPRLLKAMRPWFTHIVVGVQESPDRTLEIARSLADVVVEDEHWGYAEPTFQKVIDAVETKWVFIVSGDEMPSEDLLDSMQDMVSQRGHDGWSILFRSSIDGIDFTAETDRHTRLFRMPVKWLPEMHYTPDTTNPSFWNTGYISHDRSLDEMMLDYLVYYEKGKAVGHWERHNTMMMREACKGVAAVKGWEYVKGYKWWPQVAAIAFTEGEPS